MNKIKRLFEQKKSIWHTCVNFSILRANKIIETVRKSSSPSAYEKNTRFFACIPFRFILYSVKEYTTKILEGKMLFLTVSIILLLLERGNCLCQWTFSNSNSHLKWPIYTLPETFMQCWKWFLLCKHKSLIWGVSEIIFFWFCCCCCLFVLAHTLCSIHDNW